jgi:hypothetical protein
MSRSNKLIIWLAIGDIFFFASLTAARAQDRSHLSSTDLAFFRMIDDKTTYEKPREKFELVTASDSRGSYQ